MKKLLLGLALASATLIACQNPSQNTVEAGAGPEICPATGTSCQMDKAACDATDTCDMGAKSDCGDCGDAAGCDMEASAGCDMEASAGCDMEAKGGCCDAMAEPVSADGTSN